MPVYVADAFSDFLSISPRRSLERLASLYRARGTGPAIATLKRWSSRYDWKVAAARHDRETVAVMAQNFKKIRGIQIRSDAEAIIAAKQRFYERVFLDPDDPTLTPAQRRRALRPNLTDFRRMIKIERMLLSEADTSPEAQKEKPAAEDPHLTPDEIHVMVAALTRYRHGLP